MIFETAVSRSRFALLACTLLAAGCDTHDDAPKIDPHTPRSVLVATVHKEMLGSLLVVSGQLVAREEVAISSQVSGYQVTRVLADQGQWVRPGEALALLDGTLLRSDIATQQAAVAQAEVTYDQARQKAERVRNLGSDELLSQEAIADRKWGSRSAAAQLRQAQAQLSGQRVRERLLTVRSPVAGLVLGRSVRIGDLTSPSVVLFRVAAGGDVEMAAEVPEATLPFVRPGQEVALELATGRKVIGHVRLAGVAVDSQTRLGTIRIALPRDPEIIAGGFARGTIALSAHEALVIPEKAIRYTAAGPTVTVVGKNNRVEARGVRLGQRGGGMVALLDGPDEGARVLIGAQSFLLDGDQVKPVAASDQRREPGK